MFPGPDSMTVQELADYISKDRRKRGAERSAEDREAKKAKLEETILHTHSHTHASEDTRHTQEHTCHVQRVIFIDSTWNQTTKIISDERLLGNTHKHINTQAKYFFNLLFF